jgi:hypothetical protein
MSQQCNVSRIICLNNPGYLQIVLGIPVAIKDDDGISSWKIETKPCPPNRTRLSL